MASKKRRPQPAGNGRGPLEFVSLGSGDGSEDSLEIPVSQLLPRPVRPDEIPELRALWWRQVALGHRMPAEIGVITIEGGAA
jgi:hypothetical protein